LVGVLWPAGIIYVSICHLLPYTRANKSLSDGSKNEGNLATNRNLLDKPESIESPANDKFKFAIFMSDLNPSTLSAFHEAAAFAKMAALILLVGLSINGKISSFWQQAIGLWVIIFYWSLHRALKNYQTGINKLQEQIGCLGTALVVALFIAHAISSSVSAPEYYQRLSILQFIMATVIRLQILAQTTVLLFATSLGLKNKIKQALLRKWRGKQRVRLAAIPDDVSSDH
jgi:hypothetical protein